MCIHTTPHVYTHHSSCVHTVHTDHQEDVTKIWEDIQLMKACRGSEVVCAALTAGANTLIAM